MHKASGLSLFMFLFPALAFGAGLEFPDNGAMAMGRGGAVAASPDGAMALQYNPAGLAKRKGFHLDVEYKLSNMNVTYTPNTSEAAVSNNGGIFPAPAGMLAYGFGQVGPFSNLTIGAGGYGPSSIGVVDYPVEGAQRYALIDSDYFIAMATASVAVAWEDWLDVGFNMQMATGRAKFRKAVYSGVVEYVTAYGADYDSVSTVDVSGSSPLWLAGVTLRPMDKLSIGLSYRPQFNFEGDGTLTTEISALGQALGVKANGDKASMVVPFPQVARLGILYQLAKDCLVEADFVYEGWSAMQSIDVVPDGIKLVRGTLEKDLPTIQIVRMYRDAWSARVGGDWGVIPDRLTLRGGYIYETSAIKQNYTSVDNANWGRNAIGLGLSVNLWGAWLDLGYSHHFIPSRTLTNAKHEQTVSPCLTSTTCEDLEPAIIGNGTYEGSFDVFGLAVRMPFSELRGDM